jgi:hypothetical protein
MAEFVKSPFKERIFKNAKRDSSFDSDVKAGGDIKIGGQDVVIGGPKIGDEGDDYFTHIAGLTKQAK